MVIQDISASMRNFILCMKNTASLQPKEADRDLVMAQQQKLYVGRVTNLHALLSHNTKAFWEMLQAKSELPWRGRRHRPKHGSNAALAQDLQPDPLGGQM
jgi:hypothetical protein